MGGTSWANVSTQYYEKDSSGRRQYVSNDPGVLAGIWVDDSNPIAPIKNTTGSAPAGSGNTYTILAQGATRAAAHFGVSGSRLDDANFIIAQPPAYSDRNAISSGSCAFHDYALSQSPGNSYYNDPNVEQGLSYTDMLYSLAINSNRVNVCGENAVNTDPEGRLDGFWNFGLSHRMLDRAEPLDLDPDHVA
jgi:hypothetical protein